MPKSQKSRLSKSQKSMKAQKKEKKPVKKSKKGGKLGPINLNELEKNSFYCVKCQCSRVDVLINHQMVAFVELKCKDSIK